MGVQNYNRKDFILMAISKTTLNEIINGDDWRSRQKHALRWLREKYLILTQQLKGKLRLVTPASVIRESPLTQNIKFGRMYFYGYNPKTKAKLPFYDSYPLVIPINIYSQSRFLGINFHYLPYKMRAILMSECLQEVRGREDFEYMNVKYSKIVNNLARFKSAIPCLHQYDARLISTPIAQIEPDEWITTLYLPIERFNKRSRSDVWSNSMEIIEGING